LNARGASWANRSRASVVRMRDSLGRAARQHFSPAATKYPILQRCPIRGTGLRKNPPQRDAAHPGNRIGTRAAPTGRKIVAQGNALGNRAHKSQKP